MKKRRTGRRERERGFYFFVYFMINFGPSVKGGGTDNGYLCSGFPKKNIPPPPGNVFRVLCVYFLCFTVSRARSLELPCLGNFVF